MLESAIVVGFLSASISTKVLDSIPTRMYDTRNVRNDVSDRELFRSGLSDKLTRARKAS